MATALPTVNNLMKAMTAVGITTAAAPKAKVKTAVAAAPAPAPAEQLAETKEATDDLLDLFQLPSVGAAVAAKTSKTAKVAKTTKATERGKTVRKEKEEKGLKGIPKQPLTVQEWADAKEKYPEIFTYTPEGDLKSPATRPTEQDKIIVLPRYIPSTNDEIMTFFKERNESLKEPENDYTIAKRALNQLMLVRKQNPKAVPIYEVLMANQKVHDAECVLNAMAKSPRNIKEEESVQSNLLTFDWYDRTVNPQVVILGEYTTFPEGAFWRKAAAGLSQLSVGEVTNNNVNSSDNNESEAQQQQQQKPKRQLTGAQIAMINRARAQK